MENYKVIEEYFPFFKRVEYKGKEIIHLDITNSTPEESIEKVNKTYDIIQSFPRDSILFFTNYTGVRYNKESMKAAKDFMKNNKPYVKKSSLIGIIGLKKIVLSRALTFAGRTNVKVFDHEKEALDWLVDY